MVYSLGMRLKQPGATRFDDGDGVLCLCHSTPVRPIICAVTLRYIAVSGQFFDAQSASQTRLPLHDVPVTI